MIPMACINSIFHFKHAKRLIKFTKSCHRNKSFNSAEWLKRRDMDIYTEKAKRENYRCRSAYKLIEIEDKYKLIKPGHKVLDVGASPGSWSQVLAQRTNSNEQDPNSPKGLVIAVDIAHIFKIEGVTVLSNTDFTKQTTQDKIVEILQGEKLDFVLSDMAPKATGIKSLDQENMLNLVYPVFLFSVKHLKTGGGCLIKVWDGKNQKLANEMKRFFENLKFVKPSASYSSSSELYFLGRGFLGLKI